MAIKKNKYIVFGSPQIKDDEIREVIDTLKSGWIGSGPKVLDFQNKFKDYKNTENAVALNSCTAALHLSLLALKLKKNDEVITTPMTFCATINSIIHSGAKPILVDVDPETMNIDTEKIEEKITKKTKAILPVHFAGRPCNMKRIMQIAEDYNLKIIEDCAHAIETEYEGKGAGTFGDFGCFSFYVTKNLVTGEGGMVITNDKKKADYIKRTALHGLSKDAWKRFSDEGYQHYFVQEPGYKYNMMDIQASLGIHQLKRIEKNWKIRKKIWEYYNASLSDLPLKIPMSIEKNTKHAYHLYTIMINKKNSKIGRDDFLQRLHNLKIGTGVHYQSITEHPYYKNYFNWNSMEYPHSLKIGRETVSLPMSPNLSTGDIERVVESVKKILNKG